MKKVKPIVFWPPFILLLLVVALSFLDAESFRLVTTSANKWVLDTFGWLFSLGTLLMLVTCIGIYFSPLGKLRIGGEDAKPFLTRWRWFAITLCTTIAVGLLFWATAEPLYHLHSPPKSMGLESMSVQSARFALSSMYLHWTFTPYAIYTVPALVFAIAYYNLKKPFSLGASLSIIFGKRIEGRWGQVIDAVCLYSLVAGMAASLGTGIMTLSGGVQHLFGISSSTFLWAVIAILIVATFITSAATGLMKGIRILSDINIRVFFAIGIFVFIFGPTTYIITFGLESFWDYISQFIDKSLFTGLISGDPWPKSWTVFYWANWLAWAPITALFLGRISYGYTVKDFIRINLVAPALFGCIWMAIFSGATLKYDLAGSGNMYAALIDGGPEAVVYNLFGKLPLSGVVTVVFILASFLSYVTAADSNTEALGGISSTGISPESPSPGLFIKLLWGITIGTVAWVMISFAGIDGVKMISNLGGLPALFLVLIINIALIKIGVLYSKGRLSECC